MTYMNNRDVQHLLWYVKTYIKYKGLQGNAVKAIQSNACPIILIWQAT